MRISRHEDKLRVLVFDLAVSLLRIDRWIPLGNWNGEHHWPVHNVQFCLDIFVGAVLLVAILSFRANFRAGMILGTALLSVWVYDHVRDTVHPPARGQPASQNLSKSSPLPGNLILPGTCKGFGREAKIAPGGYAPGHDGDMGPHPNRFEPRGVFLHIAVERSR